MELHNGSVSAHQRRLAKRGWKGAKAPPPPDDVKVDHELGYLVDWYERLRRQTPRGMAQNPILYSEILAFTALYGLDVDALDIDTLEKLDAVWLNCLPKRSQSG